MSPETPSQSSNKRKRDGNDQDAGRNLRSNHANGGVGSSSNDVAEMNRISQELLQEIGPQNGVQNDENTRTARAALETPLPTSVHGDTSFETPHSLYYPDDPTQTPSSGLPPVAIPPTADSYHSARDASGMSNKPPVGTPQWHQLRKDNHKEGRSSLAGFSKASLLTCGVVERRRREAINEGINEIAKLVPNCEKNKGSILQRAVEYIREFMQKEHNWQIEKGTLDTAIRELSFRFDKMKNSAEQAWKESNRWQQRCKDAGLVFDDYDDALVNKPDGDDDKTAE